MSQSISAVADGLVSRGVDWNVRGWEKACDHAPTGVECESSAVLFSRGATQRAHDATEDTTALVVHLMLHRTHTHERIGLPGTSNRLVVAADVDN
jgi:hypothetical protein